jgi:hypothetical protein
MAFLDNSGDIILDAVLTEGGRKRMAAGNFKITKFALGDDGINYALYNPNTGSAYTDLEILQTPVLEATTQTNANISYGLLSIPRNDMLYLPRLKINELVENTAADFNNVFYLAVNSETADALEGASATANTKYVLRNQTTTGTKIILESGLDGAGNDGITGTRENQTNYLVNLNLDDETFQVYVDSRFLVGVYGPRRGGGRGPDPGGAGSMPPMGPALPPSLGSTTKFSNQPSGQRDVNLPLEASTGRQLVQGLTNYSAYSINGIVNGVYYTGTSTAATTVSAINGPRARVTAVNFAVDIGLTSVAAGARSSKYSLYGSIGQDLFSDGKTYDYIDVLVYVVGTRSAAQYQLPIRVTRRAS